MGFSTVSPVLFCYHIVQVSPTSRKDTHLTAKHMSRVIQQNWLVDTIGCVFPFGLSGVYPTPMDRIGNGLLSRLSVNVGVRFLYQFSLFPLVTRNSQNCSMVLV